jgi:hypothetical protein
MRRWQRLKGQGPFGDKALWPFLIGRFVTDLSGGLGLAA